MVQPFSRLYNGSWVFSAISENVQVTLQCPDGNIPTSLMGFGIVGLAEGCTISNEEFWYPHTFAGKIYVINIPFSFNIPPIYCNVIVVNIEKEPNFQ